jgi:probable phosphoglycerate mutase
MTDLWFIRHGETDWNIARRLQGWQDTPLNGTGVVQARRLAQRLRGEAARAPFAALYSSDLQRTQATAQAIGAAVGLPVQVDPGIRERNFGVLEGLCYDTVEQDAPEAAAAWKSREPDRVLEGGETLGQFRDRVAGAVNAIARRHPGGRVLAVTHGGALDIIWRQASGTPLSAPRHTVMHNAGINRVKVGENGWEVIDWGDISHMDSARDDIV